MNRMSYFVRQKFRRIGTPAESWQRNPAFMGDGQGAVRVSGKSGYVYVRFLNGQVWTAYNAVNAPAIDGYMIWVGTSPDMPGRLQVLGLRDVYAEPGVVNIDFDPVLLTWPERLTAYIRGEQFLPGLAIPSTSDLKVRFLSWIASIAGTPVITADQTVDLSSHAPAAGARWLLVQIESDGSLGVVEGDVVDSRELLLEGDIPEPDSDAVRFWAFRAYDGMERFIHGKLLTDLVDFRFGFGTPAGGGGAATQIIETDGPTTLDITGIGDGEYLKRDGMEVVGAGIPAALYVTMNRGFF